MEQINFGKLLKQELNKIGITQTELAKRINISQQGLTGILNSSHINTSRIEQLSKALNINFFEKISAHFNNDKTLTVNEPIDSYNRTSVKRIRVFIEVDEDKQSQIMKIIGL